MELKYSVTFIGDWTFSLLIEPNGIEIRFLYSYNLSIYKLLIEPDGIEIIYLVKK